MMASEQVTPPLYGTVLLKAKAILDFILNTPTPPNLKEISDNVPMTKSTVFKILKTLEFCGFVRCLGEEKRYYLGTTFLSYAQKTLSTFDINLVAKPFLAQLRDETNETVNLGILDTSDSTVTLLAKLESPNSINLVSRVGKGMHLYSSAMGKAMLSCLPENEFDAYLTKTDLVPLTEDTITDKKQLCENIQQAKANGYAIENNENQKDVLCVGFPLYKDGRIYGAFSVSAPRYRVAEGNLALFIEKGRIAQQNILAVI
ncbi:IclR family transcriptional regulator [Agrilactobacillus yilanensis]|uniref:IclR family transcriptional regulator n=1 Tax=Agrilactobacillus yilanensis TaxID=2485997 RepID=A0ABW4J567_9LACO|nr:IclR family transcriptional regulator [Agrilactobacillus yilanensis]